jgi:cytochrome c oxidase cbb3-type subunit 1
MLILWFVLALQPKKTPLRLALLLVLLPIPIIFYWACSRDIYPTVNPHSGGATGTGLLGSTLGIIAIFAFLPTCLRIPLKRSLENRPNIIGRAAFALSALIFALISHGHASHHELSQALGLGTLLAWGPLTWHFLNRYTWHEYERRWKNSALIWWILLLHTGWITFLPGISERLKFTHALVAHSHLAMAGLVTSVLVIALQHLDLKNPLRGSFWLWQLGTAAHILILMTLGWLEHDHSAELFYGADWTQTFFYLRLIAGLAMWTASLHWFTQNLCHDANPRSPQ